jgi:hypothetical protein
VSDDCRDAIETTLREHLKDADLVPDADAVILSGIGAHVLRDWLPGQILRSLEMFSSNSSHAILIDNLPRQLFPRTPTSGFSDESMMVTTNAVHLGLIQLLGLIPYAAGYENDGRLMGNVVPSPVAAGQTSSRGSDTEFFWHTDNPHLPFGRPGGNPRAAIPRFLTFLAIRNIERVSTDLMAIESAVAAISPDRIEVLTSESFEISAPQSNDPTADGHRMHLTSAPLLIASNGTYWVRFDRDATSAENRPSRAALADWISALQRAAHTEPVLTTGRFLVFDNYRVLHRRKAFQPAADGRERWLRRCYAS